VGLGKDLRAEADEIFRSKWETTDVRAVPDPEDLRLGNDGAKMSGAVLYADIDGSTAMVDEMTATKAAKVYKAYLHCAAKIVKSEGGSITAYDGDRIMAVFIGDAKCTSAVRAGLRIRWATDEIVNPAYKAIYKDSSFVLKQVGIDVSDLMAARIGVRGDNDLVWVGRAANYAAKLSSLSEQPYTTFITKSVYDVIREEVKTTDGKSMWEERQWRNMTIYRSSWRWRVDE